MYKVYILLLLEYTLHVWCQNISLTADQWCYHEGDALILNATYSGNETLGMVEWNFKPDGERAHHGSGLNIRVPDCFSFGLYPNYFPGQNRTSFHCSQIKVFDSVSFAIPSRSHIEAAFTLRINDTTIREMSNATWTVILWSFNSLPLPMESILIQDCKDKKWISSTKAVTKVVSSTPPVSTNVTFVSGAKSVNNKSSPYVLSPTDMYNIIGK
ncbi:uncharacterized protein LOC132724592 isoform X2 [Ruditapes philippinarum]|uniref:uncharacterized protein LOC132724592 isoform X2 n=1 Tax=Ruditapes philippinarum TaxID=129788 RepID=UPI00295C32EE|nr:uncharacterized protein LOC132724592 isoform X2 [Ruditapes philippinarum]